MCSTSSSCSNATVSSWVFGEGDAAKVMLDVVDVFISVLGSVIVFVSYSEWVPGVFRVTFHSSCITHSNFRVRSITASLLEVSVDGLITCGVRSGNDGQAARPNLFSP